MSPFPVISPTALSNLIGRIFFKKKSTATIDCTTRWSHGLVLTCVCFDFLSANDVVVLYDIVFVIDMYDDLMLHFFVMCFVAKLFFFGQLPPLICCFCVSAHNCRCLILSFGRVFCPRWFVFAFALVVWVWWRVRR